MNKTKRDLILETALNLFTEKGYHSTPTSLIVKEARVATGTLFHHFKTKEDLLNTLYLDIKHKMKIAIESKVVKGGDFTEKLEIFWFESINWSLNNPTEANFLNSIRSSIDLTMETIQTAMEEFCFAHDLFLEGIEKGKIKPLPLDVIFEFIGSLYLASVDYFMRNRDKFADEDQRKMIFSIVRDSLRV